MNENLSNQYKSVMANCAHSVGVITTTDLNGVHHGCTVTGYISIDANPALFGIVLKNNSGTLRSILDTYPPSHPELPRYAFNLLNKDQEDQSVKFSTHQYSNDDFSVEDSVFTYKNVQATLPYIKDASATMFLKYVDIKPFDNSTIVIGQVVSVFERISVPSLIYQNRQYKS